MLKPLVWCCSDPTLRHRALPRARYNNCLKDSYKESGQATWGNAVGPNILRDLYNWISEQGPSQESHHEIFNLGKSDYLTSWPGWSLNSIRSPDLDLSSPLSPLVSDKNRISFIAVCASLAVWLTPAISLPARKVWGLTTWWTEASWDPERFDQVGLAGQGEVRWAQRKWSN